jgi:hypothetical protein
MIFLKQQQQLYSSFSFTPPLPPKKNFIWEKFDFFENFSMSKSYIHIYIEIKNL